MRGCLLTLVLALAAPVVAAGPPTLKELDAACEAARQAKLEPIRQAEIAKCKVDERNDPAYCERYYKDYGEGGRNLKGAPIPRMFDDLPECVAAQEARRDPKRH